MLLMDVHISRTAAEQLVSSSLVYTSTLVRTVLRSACSSWPVVMPQLDISDYWHYLDVAILHSAHSMASANPA